MSKNIATFNGQSRTLTVVPFHRQGMVSVLYSNCVRKTHLFFRYLTSKCRDPENRVRGPSRSLEMSPFDIAHTTFIILLVFLLK